MPRVSSTVSAIDRLSMLCFPSSLFPSMFGLALLYFAFVFGSINGFASLSLPSPDSLVN